MSDEFNKQIDEFNPDVAEHKIFGDIECFSLRREFVSVKENISAPENFNESPQGKATNDSATSKDLAKEQKDRLDNATKQNKRSIEDTNTDTNPLLNSTSATSSAAAQTGAGASAASTAASSASVVSSATLTGMTILAGAAVVAISVGTTILNKEPKVNLISSDYGTEYVQYELAIEDLTPGSEYVLRLLHGQTVVYKEDITEDGVYKKLINGLTPNRTYVLQLIEKDNLFGHERFNHTFWTDDSDVPKANFDFDSRVDFDKGEFILDYNIYISDHYKTGRDTYLEIYSGENYDKLIVKDDNVEDNYIKGALTDLPDGIDLLANVYTTYTDKKTGIEENRLIGSYKYLYKYPETDAVFSSSFDLNQDSFNVKFDKSSLTYNIDIDTGFEAKDSSESYKIELYCDDDLIDSKTSTESSVSFDIPVYYQTVSAKIIPIKETEEGMARFKEIECDYDIKPSVYSSVAGEFYDDSYFLDISLNSELFTSEDTIYANIDTYDSNGNKTSNKMNFQYDEYHRLYVDGYNVADVPSRVYVEVMSGDTVIGKLDFNNVDSKMVMSSYEIDDDGNIIVDYDISDAKGYEFNAVAFECNGDIERPQTDSLEPINQEMCVLYDKQGKVKINYIESAEIVFNNRIMYKNGYGAIVNKMVTLDPIKLSVDVKTDTYVSYILSSLAGNIKFEVLADNKPVNMGLSVDYLYLDEIQTAYINPKEGKYITISGSKEEKTPGSYDYDFYIQYRITTEGLDNEQVKIDIPDNLDSWYQSTDTELFNYTVEGGHYVDYVNYIKTNNEDGTVNYYFYPNFQAGDTLHSHRLEYSYKDEYDMTHYLYTEPSNAKYIALENVSDLEYTFNYLFLYNYTDGLTYLASNKEGKPFVPDAVIPSTSTDINIIDETTNFTFFIKHKLIDTSDIIFNVLGTDYAIDFKQEGDDGVTVTGDGLEYEVDNGSYNYSVMITSDQMRVELSLPERIDVQLFKDSPPTILAKFKPEAISVIGENNIKAVDTFVKDYEMPIFKFGGKFTLPDDFSIENNVFHYTSGDTEYEIDVQGYEFTSDSYDEEIVLEIYDESDVLIKSTTTRGTTAYAFIPNSYTSVKIRLKVVKHVGQSDIYYNDIDMGTYVIE